MKRKNGQQHLCLINSKFFAIEYFFTRHTRQKREHKWANTHSKTTKKKKQKSYYYILCIMIII